MQLEMDFFSEKLKIYRKQFKKLHFNQQKSSNCYLQYK